MIVQKFLENNMIHMLGTDVHRQNTIYPKIPEIILELKSLIGEEKVKELTTINPELVINNKRIDIRKPYKVELTLKEKRSNLYRRYITKSKDNDKKKPKW